MRLTSSAASKYQPVTYHQAVSFNPERSPDAWFYTDPQDQHVDPRRLTATLSVICRARDQFLSLVSPANHRRQLGCTPQPSRAVNIDEAALMDPCKTAASCTDAKVEAERGY